MSTIVTVIGAGSWGTTLAIHAHNCGHRVRLWVHGNDTLEILRSTRENKIYLPGFPIPTGIELTNDRGVVTESDYVFLVVPSLYFRSIFTAFSPYLKPGAVLISAIKGMEPDTSKRISQVVEELAGTKFIYSILSGPSFAKEVAQKQPTAVVIGSAHREVGRRIQEDFSTAYFRLYYNHDVTGVEIGGSVKNIIAIAAGVVSGLGYGYNTLSGLITRGLAELNRFAIRAGSDPATLSGLAGLGDLILTCTADLSRNRQVGFELGRGKKISEITAQSRMIAEGVRTAEAIHKIAKRLAVDMPITEQVHRLLYKDHDPRTAILELMSRELKEE